MVGKAEEDEDDQVGMLNELELLDAQRVIGLMEHALAKLSVIESLTAEEPAEGAQGEEVTQELDAHRKLEKKYEELIRMRLVYREQNNKVKIRENQLEIQQTQQALRQSTRLLCRNLQDNPNLAENNMKIQRERAAVTELLDITVRELYGGHFDTLSKKVNSERRRERKNAQLVSREKELSTTLEGLKKELAVERKEYEQELAMLNAQSSDLKEKVQAERMQSAINHKYHEKEKRAHEQTTQRMNDKRETELNAQIRVLNQKIVREKTAHEQTIEFLKQKTNIMGNMYTDWIDKSEKDVPAMEAKLESLRNHRGDDKTKLSELAKSYDVDVAERQMKAAEERRQKQMKEMQEAERKRRVAAAIRIQAYYRMHSAQRMRKQLTEGKGKKGKKGGGGKKGKKK
jgi:hypothetical protein